MEEGPRKLFKTISLVDRLKGSVYDTILPSPPVKDKSVEGQVVLKSVETQLNTPKKGVALDGIPSVQSKEPIILKTLLDSPSAQLPTPSRFTTNSLNISNTPPIKVQFADNISLEDRLNQSKVTETKHLPKYFLSDTYTGYLTISPFFTPALEDTQQLASGELDDPSAVNHFDLQIPRSGNPEVQLDTPNSETATLQLQGTFISNNVFESISQIKEPLGDTATLTTQGVYIINNSPNTFVETVDSIPTAQINQGSIELPIYEAAIDQGVALDLVDPPSLIEIASLQGLYINNGVVAGSLQQLEIIGYETDRALAFGSPAIKHGAASLVLSEFEANKNNSIENPLTVHGSTELSVIGYETDRALAFGSPAIKHGAAQLAVTRYLENRTEAINTPILLHGESILKAGLPTADKQPTTPAINTIGYQADGQPSPTDVGGIGVRTYNDGDPEGDGALQIAPDNRPEDIKATANYNSIAYGSIGTKFNPPKKRANSEGVSPFAAEEGAKKPDASNLTDFIDLKFTPEGGTAIQFRAYLTSFSDGITANWNDIQYVGRIDTLKQYKGTTRAMSLSFLLPAFSKEDVEVNMKKLEALIGATVVGTFGAKDNFVSSPLVKIRVGGLINSYCAVSTVKWDFDPAEATFDIDPEVQMPHMFKITVDAAVLGTSEDKLLNGADGNYFTKSYA
jgi:hypothetical protein